MSAATPSHIHAIFYSIDPTSISHNLAFYELYSHTPEGKIALQRAWELLRYPSESFDIHLPLPTMDTYPILSLIGSSVSPSPLTQDQVHVLKQLGNAFANRSLLGSTIWTEEEILSLPSDEIDLARALLIYQFAEHPDAKNAILSYEATLDLMALQIRARLSHTASHEEKVSQINHFIFQEMGFRYPPHSSDVKHIDLYTFLPSVIDGRKGVCLGVSVLYLCLAQRLDLPLEIVTPPGHIYLRLPTNHGVINIETTARGIHMPSEKYLGVNTRSLPIRSLKEVIGMVFTNQASLLLHSGQYTKASLLHDRIQKYMPYDPLLQMFRGICYLLSGREKEGKKTLKPLSSLLCDHAVSPETIPEDYLKGRIDIDGLQLLFLFVDENRSSLLEKASLLEKKLRQYPKFRAGILQLATTYFQLNHYAKAYDILLSYHAVDPNDATIEYYLSILSLERWDYPSAYQFLKNSLSLTRRRNHLPKALLALQREILSRYPAAFIN